MVPLVTSVSRSSAPGDRRNGRPERRSAVRTSNSHSLQTVLGEDPAAGAVKVPAQPGDPAEDLHRGDVESGSFPVPRLHQTVHLVSHTGQRSDQES